MATEFQLINTVIQQAVNTSKQYTVQMSSEEFYNPDDAELDEAWELYVPDDMPVELLGLYKTVIRECIDAYMILSNEESDEDEEE